MKKPSGTSNQRKISLLLLSLLLLLQSTAWAEQTKQKDTAIVMAAFGTSVPHAINGILNIRKNLQKSFPNSEVRIAFTSTIIRSIWHERQDDAHFLAAHKNIPKDILMVQSPLATIANLQDEGYKTILVQPGHISLGEEYLDLVSCVNGLNSIKTIKKKFMPFDALVIGRPALGTMGHIRPYPKDIERVAKALQGDLNEAEKQKAALVYMGHGNDYFPSGGGYLQFADTMNTLSRTVKTYIGTVEGFPSLDNVIAKLKKDKINKIILKPFMTVAGDHAMNDMAGDEEDSWKTILVKEGFEVIPVMQGLGEIDSFANVFSEHLAETAADNNISLQ